MDERSSSPVAYSTRRGVLSAIGGAGLLATGAGAVAARGRRRGFPPAPRTTWPTAEDGERWTAPLGDGEVTTFASTTPSGRPIFVGVHLTRDALTGLPSAAELDASGEGLDVHGVTAKEYFLPLPDAAPDPLTFVGFYWNPEGHAPPHVYGLPHFDVHFHFEDEATVTGIEPGVADYELPAERVPEGYVRAPNPETGHPDTVIHMGEHVIDPSAPEHQGETFRNALLWGAHDLDGDGVGELNFVEPMLTVDYLQRLDGTDERPIAQPDVYPKDGFYPTAYSARPVDDGVAIALQDFVAREA